MDGLLYVVLLYSIIILVILLYNICVCARVCGCMRAYVAALDLDTVSAACIP